MSGYVRLYRSLIGHVEFRNDAEAMAFAWLIARAAWAPVCVRYKDRKISLERGQLAISQRDMAKAMDRDKGWVERLWRRLQNAAMIKAEGKAGVAVITICNYDHFQATEGSHGAANGAAQKAGARQGQGTEQEREEREEKKKSGSAYPPPPSVSEKIWGDYLKLRTKKKAPMSDTAYSRLTSALEGLSKAGHKPDDIVGTSVERGWIGFFEPTQDKASGKARMVSASGHEYRGSLEEIKRMASRRRDSDTEWECEKRLRQEREAQPLGKLVGKIVQGARR